MKKIYFLLLLIGGLSINAYSQDMELSDEAGANNGGGVFNARAPYCNPCHRRHYGPCPPPSNSTPVPFDGGLGILLVAGAVYGVKRIRGKKHTSA